MSLMHKVRVYHAALAALTLLAYLSGDLGVVHDVLGYGVAVIIFLRLIWAVFNPRQLGLNRFYPDFDGLRFDNAYRHPAVSKALILGIAVTLIGATVTGVALEGGEDEFIEDIHEALSNLLMVFVVAHGAYLLLFKRPLARFMLYRDRRKG